VSNYTVENVAFGPDGIRISYMTTTDVRAEGAVYQAHTLAIAWGVEDEAILELMGELDEKAVELLQAAILHWAKSAPVDLIAERQRALDDNDDDEGLGGN